MQRNEWNRIRPNNMVSESYPPFSLSSVLGPLSALSSQFLISSLPPSLPQLIDQQAWQQWKWDHPNNRVSAPSLSLVFAPLSLPSLPFFLPPSSPSPPSLTPSLAP
jgi:hypothetical protein